ncbi:hypothetical protein ACGF3J_38465 [Streptomyces sp. NPDC048171]|nr:hypothetical protein [Streptomyces sp. SID5789]
MTRLRTRSAATSVAAATLLTGGTAQAVEDAGVASRARPRF